MSAFIKVHSIYKVHLIYEVIFISDYLIENICKCNVNMKSLVMIICFILLNLKRTNGLNYKFDSELRKY